MKREFILPTSSNQCTDTFSQQLCVEFETTFSVHIKECKIVSVDCMGPCDGTNGNGNGNGEPCVFTVTHPVTGSTATYYITFDGVFPSNGNFK